MSFFGAALGGIAAGLFGEYSNKKARKALAKGGRRANTAVNEAYDESLLFLDEGLEDSQEYLTPYVEDGDRARNLYNTYLGLNGRESQANEFENFQTDPGFQSLVDYGQDQVERSYANRGGVNSGRAMIALADNAQKHLNSAYQQRLDRLGGVASTGYDASKGLADLVYNTGANKASFRTNLGQQIASNNLVGAGAQAQSYANSANLVGSTLSGLNSSYNYYNSRDNAQGNSGYGSTQGYENPIDQLKSVGTYLPNGQKTGGGGFSGYLERNNPYGVNNFSGVY